MQLQIGGKKCIDWEDFIKKFKKTFVRRSNILEAWKTMNARTQGKGESVMGYFTTKLGFVEA